MWPKPGQGLDRVLAGEAAVEGLYREALTRWSPVAMAAALPTFGAAVTADASPASPASTDPQLPPDPAAVEQSSGWTTVAETVIVAGVAVLFAAAVVEAMEGLGIPLPSIGLPGLPGKRQESAGNPQVAPPTSRVTVTRDQAKQSHPAIPDRPPAPRADPIPAPLAPNPQETAAKPLVAPDLDPVVLAIVNDAATDMDAAQLHEAMRIVDETPALAQARDAVIETQRDAAARTPHVVAQKVTAAIRDAEPTDGTVTLAAQRSAAAEVLDPDSDAMAQIAATAGHLSAAVQNQAVQAAALLSEDADELEKFWACVHPDTVVSAAGVSHLARRHFKGTLVSVRTASGAAVSLTPEHRVLTGRGWVEAQSLHMGDDLFKVSRADAARAPGVQDPPSSIGQVVDAAMDDPATEVRTVRRRVNLDGDTGSGYVNVVATDGDLAINVEPLGPQAVRDLLLADADSLGHAAVLRSRGIDNRRHRLDATAVLVGDASVELCLDVVGNLGRADYSCSRLVPNVDSRGGQDGHDRVPAGVVAVADRLCGLSAEVRLDDLAPGCGEVGAATRLDGELLGGAHLGNPRVGLRETLPVLGSRAHDATLTQSPADRLCAGAECGGDVRGRRSGRVATHDVVDVEFHAFGAYLADRVVEISSVAHDGYVYDLSTVSHWYLAGDLVVHNCTLDSRTRDTHWAADGARVPLTAPFIVGGEPLMFPADPAGSPAETYGCRCRMGILARDEPLPTEVDRHTERLDGRDSVAMHREGRTQVEEIEARAARGNTRARDNRDGQGTVASGGWTAPSDQEYDMTAPAVPADDTATEAAAAEAETFLTFTDALFAVTGTPTDDRRMLASAIELGFRDFPLPLQWKEKTGDGHKGSVTVGVIESATLNEQGEVRGSGYMLNNENAYKALELIQHGVNRPSIDMADATAVLAFDDGTEVTEENFDPAQRICETYTRATVTACTIVAIPAFGQTRLALNPERESRDVAMTAAALTAAAAYQHPVYEPAMFADADPNLLSPMRLTMDPDTGHVFGFIATWKDKHRSVGLGHIKPPRSHTNYEHFHTSPAVHLSDGTRLPVGRLTVGIGHAPTRGISSAAAQAHYDNVEACWALGRITEHRLGIYFSGVVAPWASPEKVQMGLASPVSGDWRPVGQGNALELVAVLSVNTPGFLCKVETDATGAPSAMVASLSVADDAPAAGSWSLDELKAVFAQVLAEDRAATLQNADKSQMVNEGLLMATPEDTQATAVDKAPAPEVDATARMGELIAQFSGTPIEPPAAPEPEVVPVELTPTERMGELIAEFEGVYVELGIRKVKNAEYWGRPAGTPITPGMKPEGKRARSQRKFDTRKKQLREIGTLFRSPKEEAEYRYMETRSGPRRASGKAAEKAAFRKQLEQSPAAEKKKPESAESINADAKLKAAQREADARHATTKARLDAESKLLADHAAKKKPDTASSALDTPEKVDAEYEKRLDALYDHLDQEYPDPEDQYDYQKAEARALKQLDDWRNEQMDQIKAKKAAPKG